MMSAYAAPYGRGMAFAGNFSAEFFPTPVVRGRLYDAPSYRVDYVDERGLTDQVSGREYKVLQNILGLDFDWLMAKNKNMAYSASRTDTWPQGDEYNFARSIIYRQSLAYQQQLNPLAMVGARADCTWRDYLKERGDQFQQDYSAFTGLQLTEASTLNLSLGYSRAELTDAGAYESNGVSETVIGTVQLHTQLSDTLAHSLAYSRSQSGAFEAGLEVVDDYRYVLNWGGRVGTLALAAEMRSVDSRLSAVSDYTDWIATLAGSLPLTASMTLFAATAYDARDNEPVPAGGLGAGDVYVENDYQTWDSTIGLQKQLTQHLSLLLYGQHTERFSDTPDLEFDRDIVGTTLNYGYDF
jgi:hypothetical protein